MNRSALLFLFASTACGDPLLMLTFETAAQYRDEFDSVNVRVYQPAAAADFGCEEIALKTVSDNILRVSLAADVSLRQTSRAPFDDLSRVSKKVFWVEALDVDEVAIANGCAEVGEIEGDTNVTIVGEPTKTIEVEGRPNLALDVGATLTEPVVLRIRDLRGNDLEGIDVRWTVEGPGGGGTSGAGVTDANGRASVVPGLPAQPGPFALQVDIRWPDQRTPSVSGFLRPQMRISSLDGPAIAHGVGRIGPTGERGFVSLIPGLGGHRVTHVYQSKTGEIIQRVSQQIRLAQPRLGVIESTNDARDRAIVIGNNNWVEVSIDGEIIARDYTPPVTSAIVESMHMIGDCMPGAPPKVLVTYVQNEFAIYNELGVAEAVFNGRFDVTNSGCVTDLADPSGALTRTAVVGAVGGLGGAVFVPAGDGFASTNWLALNQGVGFTPRLPESEALLFGTQVNLNDIVVSRFVVQSMNGAPVLRQRGTDIVPQVPIFTRGGNIDGDDFADVVALFARPQDTPQDPIQYALWANLGRPPGQPRISGDIDVPAEGMTNPVLLVIDFDGDGVDDIIIVEQSLFGLDGPSAFEIYPMGRPSQ